jgi:phosphomannomutase
MKNDLMVSISGVRGIFGESLRPDVVVQFSSGFAKFVKGKKIVIGRDGRITGKIISDLAISTLLFSGIDVVDLGIVPTPTVQLGVEYYAADGGIAITASHNPIEWNGLKFLSHTGMFLDQEEHNEFLSYVQGSSFKYSSWQGIGKLLSAPDFSSIHIKKITELPFLTLKDIRLKKFKVVVDCVNASGSQIVPDLLKEFGCEVIKINCEDNGIFPHTPEPLPQNLTELCAKVVEVKADLGIAVDPDADRLVLICEDGNPFGEEYTITQAIKFILSKKKGKAVINLSTTRAVDDVVKMRGGELIKTAVGEINVAKKMKEVQAVIGGEGSGGVILPELHYGRDSLVGIAITLQNLLEFNGSLSQLRKSLPPYFIKKERVVLSSRGDSESILKKIAENHKSEEINLLDGVKIDYPESWVIIRKSNTEPIIRIYAEAKTVEGAKSIADEFKIEIEKIMNDNKV